MRTFRLLLLGTALIGAAALPALAQAPAPATPSPAAPAGPGAGPGRFGPGVIFALVDANRDGRVTFEEVWSFAQARYGEADRNKDGALVLEEALAFRPLPGPAGASQPDANPMRARMVAAIFRAVDANADARVTLEEIRPALEAQFRALDANGDRGVTMDELPVPMRGMHHRGPHMHGGPGGPGMSPRP